MENNIQYYEIRGPLFFASCINFKESLNYDLDVDGVVINFINSRFVDQSAIIAINEVCKRYKENNINVYLSHLSQDCLELLDDASEFIEINILEDPYYRIPSNELD
ncbi:sodium-independent anion transporter [uncultured Methanobrevibacter sp.]|uniref:sodium-independent anion transporter n=1 Tax=uncultured Methanobrevibacter sp. TaxID=253161 RepID=UPI0025EB5CE7|nr:sodium-independent anion transporter [uncultured Methanobrevibacter sp.]